MNLTYDEASADIEKALGNLPANLAKILRAGIRTGARAPLIRGWCDMNPEAAALVVGTLAMLQAQKINAAKSA